MKILVVSLMTFLVSSATLGAANPKNPQLRSATYLCTSDTEKVSVEFFLDEDFTPSKINASLVIRVPILGSTASYLVKNTTGVYQPDGSYTFSYAVDGQKVEVNYSGKVRTATMAQSQNKTISLNCKAE